MAPLSTSVAAMQGLLAGTEKDQRGESDSLLEMPAASKKKQSLELRKFLHHRRGLRPLLEDAVRSLMLRKDRVLT